MSGLRVFDTTGRTDYPPAAWAQVAELGLDWTSRHLPDVAALLAEAADADLLLVTALPLTGETLDRLPKLRGVVRYGVGLDRIDLEAAAARGVAVRNVPGFCREEIADHTLGLLLAAARGLLADAGLVRDGVWARAPWPTQRLRGKRLGVVGLGAIGRGVARRAAAFGMGVDAHDPFVDTATAEAAGARLVDLPELLREADFVTLHCALTPATRHLLGAAELAMMKPTAWLINTARGGLVDQAALADAIRTGRLAGACLDVLDPEPPAADEPLLGLERVIATPHTSWYSPEANEELVVGALGQIAELATSLRGSHP